MTQTFDYSEFKRRQYMQRISREAARKVDPLIRKAMDEAAERGRAVARVMSAGQPPAPKD